MQFVWWWRFSLLWAALLLSFSAAGKEFCFTLAENYYEQVYCELQALGKGKDLPSLRDFRRNPPTTQALLLKRPAKRVGIKVPLPTKSTASRQSLSPTRSQTPGTTTAAAKAASPVTRGSFTGCEYRQAKIHCADVEYHLLGNLSNARLAKGVLDAANRMGMPTFSGNPGDSNAVNRYLSRAYAIYLQKMMEIGLAGATMSFQKFAYFFQEVSSLGISFNGRFEKLYGYLKKDKRALPITTTQPPSGLNPDYCQQPLPAVLSCPVQGRNFLFARK